MDWRHLGAGQLELPKLRTLRLSKVDHFTSLAVLQPCTALEELYFGSDCKHQLTDPEETEALQRDPSFLPMLAAVSVRSAFLSIRGRPWSLPSEASNFFLIVGRCNFCVPKRNHSAAI